MRRFRYTARRGPLELEEGFLAADSPEAVSRVLSGRGLFPISVDPAEDSSTRSRLTLQGWRAKRWSLGERALFARQLSDLLSGGLTVDASLSVLREQARTPLTRATLGAIHASVREGRALSAALEEEGSRFGGTLASAVRAGEASGSLEEVLRSIAELLEQEDSILRKVREALTYPALVATVAALTLVVLFTFVVPRVTVLYVDLEQVLPLPTRILLATSRLALSFGAPILLLILLASVLLARELPRSEKLRLMRGSLVLRLPVVGRILFLRETIRLSRILGTLIGGGVPLLDALGHVAGAIGNARFSAEVRELRREIHEGKRLSQAMRTREMFEATLTAMVRVGEESGDLAAALGKAARLHERELEGRLRQATTLLEPILIIVLGIFVAFVVFSMMLPILQMDLGVG